MVDGRSKEDRGWLRGGRLLVLRDQLDVDSDQERVMEDNRNVAKGWGAEIVQLKGFPPWTARVSTSIRDVEFTL
jgi:hypothetical protein